MSQATVSPKFPIVIPREIRERPRLRQASRSLCSSGIITAIPDLLLEKFRGILKDMSRTELREKQERI